jgi:tRNA A-37 threonylcarbamoyl transferase component Bud32
MRRRMGDSVTNSGTATQAGLLRRIGSLGDRADDRPAARLQHRFLVYMSLLMALGAVVWSALSLAFSLVLPGVIPLAYLVATAANLTWFAASKRFERARAIQIFMSVLLPFLFQWSVGGFHASGAVMLWALVAVVGALTFTTPRTMVRWLVVYSVLVVVSGLVDATVRRRFEIAVVEPVHVAFFVVNFVMISAIVLALMVYFLDQLAEAKAAIVDLEREVLDARKLGQYTLVEKLGQGGMGAVYRARHAMLRRPTALKLVRPEKADEATIARFEREVQLTATLTHPNTITIYDYGRTEDGTFYYAMEFLDGADLGLVVRLTGAMPVGRVVHVIGQIAEALAEAHKKGLIHRDIKPANVLLTQSSHAADLVKVVDFGLVKDLTTTLDKDDPSKTQQGQISGTPTYMSPEALTRPDEVDGRSDVYSLGCLAYFLLTASTVFSGESTIEVCSHHLHTTPVPLSSRSARAFPQPLEELVMHCLAKRPEDRPPTDRLVASLRVLATEPWARWEEADALQWWKKNATALAEHRAKHVESMEETVLARAPEPAAGEPTESATAIG